MTPKLTGEELIEAVPEAAEVSAASFRQVPGSETNLLSRGLVIAGPLPGFKARLLLSLLLRSGASKDEAAKTFEHWMG